MTVKELKEKLIRRHPHVFGDVVAKTPQDVVETWQKIKKSEKGYSYVPTVIPIDHSGVSQFEQKQTVRGYV